MTYYPTRNKCLNPKCNLPLFLTTKDMCETCYAELEKERHHRVTNFWCQKTLEQEITRLGLQEYTQTMRYTTIQKLKQFIEHLHL